MLYVDLLPKNPAARTAIRMHVPGRRPFSCRAATFDCAAVPADHGARGTEGTTGVIGRATIITITISHKQPDNTQFVFLWPTSNQ